MTLSKIINSSEAVYKLTNQDLPIKEAYKLHLLVEAIRTHVEFYRKQGKAIIEKYHAVYIGDGRYRVDEGLSDFEREVRELQEIDVGGVNAISLNVPETIKLSSNDITSLDGLISFDFGEITQNKS